MLLQPSLKLDEHLWEGRCWVNVILSDAGQSGTKFRELRTPSRSDEAPELVDNDQLARSSRELVAVGPSHQHDGPLNDFIGIIKCGTGGTSRFDIQDKESVIGLVCTPRDGR